MLKYIFPIFVALFIGLLSQSPAWATWTHVQGTSGAASATFGSSVTAGDLVVVTVAHAGTVTGVTDNAGGGSNTYTLGGTAGESTNNTDVYYTVVTNGGAFTVTPTGGTLAGVAIDEYSATTGTIIALNSSSGFNAGTPSTYTGGSTFFGTAPALVYSGLGLFTQGSTVTPNGSFTARQALNFSTAVNDGTYSMDYIAPGSASPQIPAPTGSLGNAYATVGLAFQSTGDYPSSNWWHVQGAVKGSTTNGVTSLALAYPSSVTVGNLAVVTISNYTASNTITVSDSGTNTWTKAVQYSNTAVGNGSTIYYSVITTGGVLTVTGHFTATDYPSISVDEYAFNAGTISVSNTNNNHGTTGDPSAGNVTFTATRALVINSASNHSSGNPSVGSGFQMRALKLDSTDAIQLNTQEQLNATSSPVTATFGSAVTGAWGSTAVTFQSTGDSGGASDSASPTTSTNAQSVVYTLTGSGTSWTGGTTFSISGVTGASITSQSVSGQVGTVTVLLDNTHTGTLTFTDSTDSASCTSAVTLAGPGIPVSPSCTAGNNQNVLNWSAPSSGGLTATYNVYSGTSPGGESGTPLATGITALTYTDSTAVNGTTYYYKIAAVNGTGTGTHSSEVSGEPEPGPSFTVSPSTNANATTVTYTITGTDTSWTSGTTFSISGVTGATISSQSCNSGTQVGTVAVLLDNTHTGTLSFTDSVDAASATSAVTLAAPGVPTSPLCTPGNAQNIVSWSAPSSGGLPATYTLLRSLTSGGETSYHTGISGTSYTDTGLTNGQIYYYKVEAVNTTGTSSASTEVNGTPISTSFTVTPSTSANNTNATYTLAGNGTNWIAGVTLFSISGVSGAKIVSQACQSPTLGAITVALDTLHTGTLTFSDSTDSLTATSAVTQYSPNSSISISPTAINHATSGNNISITGTNVSWGGTNSKPGSPTFTVSSGTIIDQQVHTTQTATIIMTAPASSGTVTITDPSSGATATLTVN